MMESRYSVGDTVFSIEGNTWNKGVIEACSWFDGFKYMLKGESFFRLECELLPGSARHIPANCVGEI